MIACADINRLAGEIRGSKVESGLPWLEHVGMGEDAMGALLASAEESFKNKVLRGDDPGDALCEIVGQVFRLGWEAHEQFGSRR